MKTDRGTCVAVGVTDATFELIRTFYVPFEDEIDDVTPVIARALSTLAEDGRAIEAPERAEIEAAPVDHLADIAAVMREERRVRTQVVLSRLAEHNPGEYEGWTFADLSAALAEHGIRIRKSDGVKVIRAEDIADAVADRDRDAHGRQGELPAGSLPESPWPDLREPRPGTRPTGGENPAETADSGRVPRTPNRSLPDPGGGGAHGR